MASAGQLLREEAFDSAVIQSDRIGGNFAYSTVEGPAYKAVAPVVRNIATPVTLVQPRILPLPYYYAPSYAGGFSYGTVQRFAL